MAALLLGAACATAPSTPERVAKADCERWLQLHTLMQRPRMGTRGWDDAVRLCVARHLPWLGVAPADVPRGRPLAPGMVSTEQALAAARTAAR